MRNVASVRKGSVATAPQYFEYRNILFSKPNSQHLNRPIFSTLLRLKRDDTSSEHEEIIRVTCYQNDFSSSLAEEITLHLLSKIQLFLGYGA